MSNRWVVDQDFPHGHLVPMTAAEQAAFDADQVAAGVVVAAQAACTANEVTMAQAAVTRLAQIRTARTALGNGTIFATLTAPEKAVIDGLLQDDLYLIRLTLGMFDATT